MIPMYGFFYNVLHFITFYIIYKYVVPSGTGLCFFVPEGQHICNKNVSLSLTFYTQLAGYVVWKIVFRKAALALKFHFTLRGSFASRERSRTSQPLQSILSSVFFTFGISMRVLF